MLEININDVIATIRSVQPQLIAIIIALLVALVMTIAVNRVTVADRGVRKLTHATVWVAAVTAAVVAINLMLTGPLNSMITMATGTRYALSQDTIETTNDLAVDIEREGITLLQNDDAMLPLSDTETINVFGWASTNPVYGGTGSGSLSDAYDTTSLLDGLHMSGFETNDDLTTFYTDYATARGDASINSTDWSLPEPPAADYPANLLSDAQNFSDTALIVISRVGGEGSDLPDDMNATDHTFDDDASNPKAAVYTDNSTDYQDFPDGAHYLELSQSERDMIDLVTDNFDNVVLVYNGANTFELGFVDEYPQIKSVLWTPHPGQAGFAALGEVLRGTTTPSGKTADTFVHDLTQTPTYENFGDFLYDNVDEFAVDTTRGERTPAFVNYVEGIYVGYRFYETAADEGAIDYDATVQYPFGYGLSYTTFDQTMGEVTYDESTGTIGFDVTVTNTGEVAGKDVVEAYVNPPYTNGGIEKSSVNLVAFEKTDELAPGASQTLHIEFDDDDMASYDYRDAKAYVLEAGDYGVSIRSDSHSIIDEQTVTVPQTIVYDSENNTHDGDQTVATNVFDEAAGDVTYLSRANHFANYDQATAAPTDFSMSDDAKATFVNLSNSDPSASDNTDDQIPTTDADNGLRLADLRGVAYDDKQWDLLLDQLTFDEMDNLIANAGYQNAAIASIGKIRLSDVDGPAALKDNFTGVSSIGLPANIVVACTWNKDLARAYGETIGDMAHEINVSGWYAPSVNIHRSAFGGRNFEYFSEDPLLTGALAAEQVVGAKSRGVYSFTKHFALNEQETRRNAQLCTWANEQSIREIYLKAFETIVKASNDAQALMGSFNYIGSIYSSAHSGLNETVLRDEWGFKGFLETDYFSGALYGYQDADQLIRNGTDAMLSTTDTTNHIDSKSATSLNAMRRATHNILYTTVNSWRYENGEPQQSRPVWQTVLIGVDIAFGVLLVGLEIIAVRRFMKRRHEVR